MPSGETEVTCPVCGETVSVWFEWDDGFPIPDLTHQCDGMTDDVHYQWQTAISENIRELDGWERADDERDYEMDR
jgi:hypothetical protein